MNGLSDVVYSTTVIRPLDPCAIGVTLKVGARHTRRYVNSPAMNWKHAPDDGTLSTKWNLVRFVYISLTP